MKGSSCSLTYHTLTSVGRKSTFSMLKIWSCFRCYSKHQLEVLFSISYWLMKLLIYLPIGCLLLFKESGKYWLIDLPFCSFWLILSRDKSLFNFFFQVKSGTILFSNGFQIYHYLRIGWNNFTSQKIANSTLSCLQK